jgi:hypothetical protein
MGTTGDPPLGRLTAAQARSQLEEIQEARAVEVDEVARAIWDVCCPGIGGYDQDAGLYRAAAAAALKVLGR